MVGLAAELWDAVAVVRYHSFALFHRLVTDPAYVVQAEPHRNAALADWRLCATTTIRLPPLDAGISTRVPA